MAFAAKQPMAVHHRRANGTLATTSVYAPGTAVGERLAYAYGDLATQVTVYACHDQLGSVRRWRTPSKGNWGADEFEPCGEACAIGAVLAPRDYALHEWDPVLAVYRAPYRNYSPTMTRWTTRDPLGMIDGPNMYGYVGGRTITANDAFGLQQNDDACANTKQSSCQDCCEQRYNEEFASFDTFRERCANSLRLRNQLLCCNMLCDSLPTRGRTGPMGGHCWTVCGYQAEVPDED